MNKKPKLRLRLACKLVGDHTWVARDGLIESAYSNRYVQHGMIIDVRQCSVCGVVQWRPSKRHGEPFPWQDISEMPERV